MNLYEINHEIMNVVNGETGEIDDFKKLEQLSMERDTKVENIALWIKNLLAEASAIKSEIVSLEEREKQSIARADSLRTYLENTLCGQAFKTAKVGITYRKSVQTVVDDGFSSWAKVNRPELMATEEPTPNKAAIKTAIAAGEEFELARLVQKQNIQIK